MLPGATLASALWFFATTLFGWYLQRYADYSILYGSLGVGIALLVWMYMISLVVLVGAEFNAMLFPRARLGIELIESNAHLRKPVQPCGASAPLRNYSLRTRGGFQWSCSPCQTNSRASIYNSWTLKPGKPDLVSGDLSAELALAAARRAKIICTIGPSCNTEAMLREMMRLGMDVARLNFSHGTHPEHARNIARLRRAAKQENRTICILQDLQGPKIRTGRLKDHEPVLLKTGSLVTITPRDVAGTPTLISTTFQGLAQEVRPGSRILLSDGLIELRVRQVRGSDVECEVVNGGMLAEHQGINLPGAALSIPALTAKDRADLEFGLKHGVDMVALSFVRSAADVRSVKEIISARGQDVPVIAKLEKPQALKRLEEIFEAADGVMVARGDLGVEMPAEKVPVIQKYVIRRAADWRKPVIIATQMLESMIENPRPTRAEASDVANAVFDGTDAVMLSAETATGHYPRETVAMMARIVVEAESNMAEFTSRDAASSAGCRLRRRFANPSRTPPKIFTWVRSRYSPRLGIPRF